MLKEEHTKNYQNEVKYGLPNARASDVARIRGSEDIKEIETIGRSQFLHYE